MGWLCYAACAAGCVGGCGAVCYITGATATFVSSQAAMAGATAYAYEH